MPGVNDFSNLLLSFILAIILFIACFIPFIQDCWFTVISPSNFDMQKKTTHPS
jgi:hypothetical protein